MNPGAKSPRTILFVDHTANLGGGEFALLDLVRHLDSSRYVPVVLLFADGPLKDRLLAVGIETHVLPLSARVAEARKDALGGHTLLKLGDVVGTLAYARRVARFMRARRVDLVHTNSLKSDLIGGLAARLAGKKIIWHVHDRIDSDYLPKRVAAAFRVLARLVPQAVIANSAATLATLRLPPAKRASVVSPGLDLTPFSAPVAAPVPSRVVGIVGRISPWKGQHIFIAAAAEVHRRFPDVRFRIVGAPLFGEQDYERGLFDTVRKLGLEPSVEFTGFRPDVADIIAGFEILVHASTTAEPFGLVAIQAMAAGKPVVATAGGGMLDIVRDGETGILVPMGDADAMAAAICRLLDDPVMAQGMGRAGRARADVHFTIQRTVEKVEALYDAMLA